MIGDDRKAKKTNNRTLIHRFINRWPLPHQQVAAAFEKADPFRKSSITGTGAIAGFRIGYSFKVYVLEYRFPVRPTSYDAHQATYEPFLLVTCSKMLQNRRKSIIFAIPVQAVASSTVSEQPWGWVAPFFMSPIHILEGPQIILALVQLLSRQCCAENSDF